MAIKNLGKSILEKLKNQAINKKIRYEIYLKLFIQEEFLRRLSKSDYKENIILKGGMYIYTLTNFASRPTKDMDFLIKNISNNLDNIKYIIKTICDVKTNYEFIKIDVISTKNITLENKYPGVQIKLIGYIDNVRIPFSIDIGIDDIVIPNVVLRNINTCLDESKHPEIYTYSLESTISEKFETIIKRMEMNSRVKDFYDIYYLSKTFNFQGEILQKAIIATINHRGNKINRDSIIRIENFYKITFLLDQWERFKQILREELHFKTVIDSIIKFLKPISYAIINNEKFTKYWNCRTENWE